MAKKRVYVLSIAGFDPSAGAGILADIKTFECHQVLGLGVTSAITYQHESKYVGTQWVSLGDIKKQIDPLFEKYTIDWVKIGLVESFEILSCIIDILITKNAQIKIVLDPILRASASLESFHTLINPNFFETIIPKLYMITPNWEEIKLLLPDMDPLTAAETLSKTCHVFLKGGHRDDKKGYDTLFVKGGGKSYNYKTKQAVKYDKHGSGCVMSAAILSNVAKGYTLHRSSLMAKRYIEDFLNSNPTLLGWHKR